MEQTWRAPVRLKVGKTKEPGSAARGRVKEAPTISPDRMDPAIL
jgi:hypothetical protein